MLYCINTLDLTVEESELESCDLSDDVSNVETAPDRNDRPAGLPEKNMTGGQTTMRKRPNGGQIINLGRPNGGQIEWACVLSVTGVISTGKSGGQIKIMLTLTQTQV